MNWDDCRKKELFITFHLSKSGATITLHAKPLSGPDIAWILNPEDSSESENQMRRLQGHC